jgi:hypothetical protein
MFQPGGRIQFPVIVLIRKGEVLIKHEDFEEYARGLDDEREDGVE